MLINNISKTITTTKTINTYQAINLSQQKEATITKIYLNKINLNNNNKITKSNSHHLPNNNNQPIITTINKSHRNILNLKNSHNQKIKISILSIPQSKSINLLIKILNKLIHVIKKLFKNIISCSNRHLLNYYQITNHLKNQSLILRLKSNYERRLIQRLKN